MWSLATFNKFGEFEIGHYETKELALMDIENFPEDYSENSLPQWNTTFEVFCIDIKDTENSNVIGFHWRPNDTEFINLEFHAELKKDS